MSIYFSSSNYLRAYKSRETISTDVEIIRRVRQEGLQFQHGNVTYDRFDLDFRSSDEIPCILYPVAVFPLVVWCGVVQTVYHVALIAFDLLATLFCSPPFTDSCCDYFQARCLYPVRDLQESFGWLISIFHESYGQYLVQEALFQKTCYDCFLVDEKLYDPESFFTKQLEKCFARGEHAKAEELVQGVEDYAIRDALKEKIALAYIDAEDLTSGKRVTDGIWKHEVKDALYAKIAYAYFTKGDLDSAIEAIRSILGSDKRKDAQNRIVNACLAEENPAGALKMMKAMYLSMNQEVDLYTKVALVYLKRKDLDKALESIQKIVAYDRHTYNDVVEKIALAYFALGKLDQSLEVAREFSFDRARMDNFFCKVAQKYLDNKERLRAISTIEEIKDGAIRNPFLVKVALSYYSELLDNQAQLMVEKIFTFYFKEAEGYDYRKMLEKKEQAVKDLFSALALQCCHELKEAFRKGNEEEILHHIKQKAQARSTLEALRALDDQPKPKPKAESKGSSNSSYSDFKFEGFNFEDYFRKFFADLRLQIVDYSKHYEKLGLTKEATYDEVRKAYKRLCVTEHPDKKVERLEGESDTSFAQRKADAEPHFREISEAHTALCEHLSPTKRSN